MPVQFESRRQILRASAAAAVLVGAPCLLRAQGKYKLKFSSTAAPVNPIAVRLTQAFGRIRTETNGEVDITLFPSGQLGGEMDSLNQLRSGAIDFTQMSSITLSTLVAPTAISGVGFAFQSYDKLWAAMDGDLGEYMRAQMTKINLVGMPGVMDYGFRHMTATAKSIRTPQDLAGFKMRVPPGPLWTSLLDCGISFRLVDSVPDHYYGTVPSGLACGRSVEVDLISGKLLGEWAHKLVRPHNMPYRITAEEFVTWGGIGNVSNWDAQLMESRRREDLLGMGTGLVAHFLHAALRGGVEVRAGQQVRRLLTEEDRVTGLELADGTRLSAESGVVIATGGYESNPAMAAAFEGLPGWDSLFPASIKGEGLVLGTRVGGAVHTIQNSLQLMVGFRVPVPGKDAEPEFWLASIRELCSPHTILVNQAGQRFADEAYFQHVAPKLREFDVSRHRHPNLPCFLIFDGSFAGQYAFAGRPAGAEIPDWVQRSDTLAGLAQKLGVDPKGLEETASRFNRDVANGRDTAFGRGESKWALAKETGRAGPRSLGAVDQPPFYGIELKPASASAAGLLTDVDGRVLRFDRTAVEGLYAVGNAAARLEFGVGYQAGYTLASGMTFGLLIAEHMKQQRA